MTSAERMRRLRARLATAAVHARGDVPFLVLERLLALGLLSDEQSRDPEAVLGALIEYVSTQIKPLRRHCG